MSYFIQQIPLTVKHGNMIGEFYRLTDRTRAVVLFVSNLLVGKYNRIPIWTEFDRTQEQQDIYYAKEIVAGKFVEVDGAKHYSLNGERPTYSVHQFHRGADLSRRNLSDNIIEQIRTSVNNVFPYGKTGLSTCLFHQQYGKSHLHFQSGV